MRDESWMSRKGDNYKGTLYYSDEDEIRDLLIGHSVVSVKNKSIILDNGVRLRVNPNEGCGGCDSGNYYVNHLSRVNNAITNVEFVEDYEEEKYDWYTHYRIYVIADGIQTELLDVYGTDGSGYYGTGYSLDVYIDNEEQY